MSKSYGDLFSRAPFTFACIKNIKHVLELWEINLNSPLYLSSIEDVLPHCHIASSLVVYLISKPELPIVCERVYVPREGLTGF